MAKHSQSAGSQLDYPETVSGRWLVKAMVGTLVVAGVALYLTVCLLFYQGQWQFTFSPPRFAAQRQALSASFLAGSWARRTGPVAYPAPISAAEAASKSGLQIVDHHFNYTEQGVARLDGWWIPAADADHTPANYAAPKDATSKDATSKDATQMVVLFCPDGQSNLPANLTAFRAFHALGVSLFAFDYRGFGSSQAGHPSQDKSYQDGTAALHYLTETRHIDPSRILVYGAEIGAAVAAQVAYGAPRIAGLVLENPQPSLAKQVRRQQHIHLLPMWLVFTNRFDISQIVPLLKMPKLIFATPAEPEYEPGATAIYDAAVPPKQFVKANATALYSAPAWQQAMQSFVNSPTTQSH
ncbi:MAG: alpha/beta hydrolase [Acidobacteriaceae bacterium]